MEELFIAIAMGTSICVAVAIPWLIFCHLMLSFGDFNDFNKRKH